MGARVFSIEPRGNRVDEGAAFIERVLWTFPGAAYDNEGMCGGSLGLALNAPNWWQGTYTRKQDLNAYRQGKNPGPREAQRARGEVRIGRRT